MIESLKVNKEIEGLAKYVGKHVIGKLDTIEKQKVKENMTLLKILPKLITRNLETWTTYLQI